MYDFDLLLKDSYTNIPEEDFLNTIAPLHENLSNGNEQWQHIIPQSLKLPHEQERVTERLTAANWIPPENFDNKHSFPEVAHTKLEHVLRTHPNMLDDLNENDRLSFQVAVDPTGWDNPHVEEIKGESSKFYNENYKQGQKPKDMHFVYKKMPNGRFQYLTATPTPPWNPASKSNAKTRYLSATPEGHDAMLHHEDKQLIPLHKLTASNNKLNDLMRSYNKENGFGENINVPKDTYKNLSFTPNQVVPERKLQFNGIVPAGVENHFIWKKKAKTLEAKGGLPKNYMSTDKNNSIPKRIESANSFAASDRKHAYMAILNLMSKNDIEHDRFEIKNIKLPNKEKLIDNKIWQEAVKEFTEISTGYEMLELKNDISMLRKMINKERKSPEAMRHKKEYDTKYESSPERIKYREDLNRERRKRGMYGDHSHRDISHTEGGKLTVEGEHENRQRHFKDKGTLRPLTKSLREDLELLRNLMAGPMDEQDKKIAQSLMTSLEEKEGEEKPEENLLRHPYFGTVV